MRAKKYVDTHSLSTLIMAARRIYFISRPRAVSTDVWSAFSHACIFICIAPVRISFVNFMRLSGCDTALYMYICDVTPNHANSIRANHVDSSTLFGVIQRTVYT